MATILMIVVRLMVLGEARRRRLFVQKSYRREYVDDNCELFIL